MMIKMLEHDITQMELQNLKLFTNFSTTMTLSSFMTPFEAFE